MSHSVIVKEDLCNEVITQVLLLVGWWDLLVSKKFIMCLVCQTLLNPTTHSALHLGIAVGMHY